MEELLALARRGDVTKGVLRVTTRAGSLEPQQPGTIAQLKSLRTLGQPAKADRTAIDNWNNTTIETRR